MLEVKTLPKYTHPQGNVSYNVRVLYEDGRPVVTDEDHKAFDKLIEGLNCEHNNYKKPCWPTAV